MQERCRLSRFSTYYIRNKLVNDGAPGQGAVVEGRDGEEALRDGQEEGRDGQEEGCCDEQVRRAQRQNMVEGVRGAEPRHALRRGMAEGCGGRHGEVVARDMAEEERDGVQNEPERGRAFSGIRSGRGGGQPSWPVRQ